VNAHRLAEERSVAFHRAVAERLGSDPDVLERARKRVSSWLASGEIHPHYARGWAEVLARPLKEIQDFLGEDSENARALRQVTPFAGAHRPPHAVAHLAGGPRGAGESGMTRVELEHVIRSAAEIANDDEIVVIGNQAILGSFPDAPKELLVSEDADVYPRKWPERADLIDGSIGEGSPFHTRPRLPEAFPCLPQKADLLFLVRGGLAGPG
jgi:hypothetical protein